MKRSEKEMLIEELEMSLERHESVGVIQNKIREIAICLGKSKDKELNKKFNNLINYFRNTYGINN